MVVIFIISLPAWSQNIPYGTGNWNRQKLGNHRVVIQVTKDTDIAWVHVPWRRRDNDPAGKAIIMVDASSGKIIPNVYRGTINQAYGNIIFEPATGKGIYYLYYMPYRTTGNWWCPDTKYLEPESHFNPQWLKKNSLDHTPIPYSNIPTAKVIRFEAINTFNSFYPMEVIATKQEVSSLLNKNKSKDFLVFPEDRKYPIRMTSHLPYRWIQKGITNDFKGVAQRHEFYVYQLGIYAAFHDLKHIHLSFSDLRDNNGNTIPHNRIRCFNFGGTDWLGKQFTKTVNVGKGKIQALWIGTDIPSSQTSGIYHGTVTLKADNRQSQQINITLKVLNKIIPDRGYDDLFRLSRLNWLDSKIGLDDSVLKPYTPVTLSNNTISILGRTLTFNQYGFPEKITSSYTEDNDGTGGKQKNILSGPIKMTAFRDEKEMRWQTNRPHITERATGAVTWVTKNGNNLLTMKVKAKMECDGYINYWVTIIAKKDVPLSDIQLQIPYNKAEATYMMGMGFKGGYRPQQWDWKWKQADANNMIWIGAVNAGLQCKLKNITPSWDLADFGKTGPYKDWSNEGKGGCKVAENNNAFLLKAFTGSIDLKRGEELHFNFGLLITPLKVLDKSHWSERYFQSDPPVDNWLKRATAKGANIINVHQGNVLNPYINYPFIATDTLRSFVSLARKDNIRTKIYYTVRELSNHTAELWALRSLGGEIFTQGAGGQLADQFVQNRTGELHAPTGGSWLVEHLKTNYDAAWHTPLSCGNWDMAIRTQGLSRWHNYYLAGLNWLLKHEGIRGLYLDGVGYDREIMKRVRKVLDRTTDSCLIDFHCGNSFHPQYGMNSPANQYMELFPYINSLWLGEGYDYNESPDYWLVEISGIPFGLYSEMLNGCGNAYRGMVYGMTSRLGWTDCDPSAMWKLWDAFGIKEAKMIGYWDQDNPVKPDSKGIRVTVYQRPDSLLIAYASWAKNEEQVTLHIDWNKIGMIPDHVQITAPAIKNFQPEREYSTLKDITVPVGGGGIILIKKR